MLPIGKNFPGERAKGQCSVPVGSIGDPGTLKSHMSAATKAVLVSRNLTKPGLFTKCRIYQEITNGADSAAWYRIGLKQLGFTGRNTKV